MSTKKYLYRLKHPVSGKYLEKIAFTDTGNPHLEIKLGNSDSSIFNTLEEVSYQFTKVDSIRRRYDHIKSLHADDVDDKFIEEDLIDLPNSKKDYIRDRLKQMKKEIDLFDSLELEFLEIKEIESKSEIIEEAFSKINESRTEAFLKKQFGSLINSSNNSFKAAEFYYLFKDWEKFHNKENWKYIIYGGAIIEDIASIKQNINLSGLLELLESLGLNYKKPKKDSKVNNFNKTGFVYLGENDFNLLRISNEESIVCYLEIEKALELRNKIFKELNSQKKQINNP